MSWFFHDLNALAEFFTYLTIRALQPSLKGPAELRTLDPRNNYKISHTDTLPELNESLVKIAKLKELQEGGREMHTGPRGGKYIMSHGHKVYIR
jgi:hypothetical protein